MATKEELLELLKDGVINYKEEQVKEAAQKAVDDGLPALEMIMDGLAAGMEVVGDLYDRQEYFVPEVLMCADALYGGLGILRPHVPAKAGGMVAAVTSSIVSASRAPASSLKFRRFVENTSAPSLASTAAASVMSAT